MAKTSQKEMANISIVFEDSVKKKDALRIISQLKLFQFQRRRTNGRNGLITYSVFVPPARAEELLKRINQEKGVVKARVVSSKS